MIKELLIVVLLMCSVRWAIAEPFLVPSGSMIPSLLIKDYILVSKFSYGLRLPFTKTWIYGPQIPKRGDVVVFRSKDDDYYFMVKRVVGLPGDRIQMVNQNGFERLSVNGEIMQYGAVEMPDGSKTDVTNTSGKNFSLPLQPSDVSERDDDFVWYYEVLGDKTHLVQYSKMSSESESQEYIVPDGHIFMVGDNRDRSSDGRAWGPLPIENILGKAQFVWMSCDEDSPAGGVFCFGEDLRANRLFKKVN